jgi:transposase InsO family protein
VVIGDWREDYNWRRPHSALGMKAAAVLTGFLTGVAVNIILGQLGDLLGSPQKAARRWSRRSTCFPIQARCR